MPVKTTWHIRYACGHEADRDLSDLRLSGRAGRAGFYADGDCPSCWGVRKRAAETRHWGEQKRAEQAVSERAAAMPALEGSEKAVRGAGQVRCQLLTAADEHSNQSGHDDEGFAADIEQPAQQITSASSWIDQSDSDPPDLEVLVADAAATGRVSTGTENRY
jgi:hypothetical protein